MIFIMKISLVLEIKKPYEKFEKMRIRSDKLAKYGQYTLGVIALNHIVSCINSLYLSRLNDELKIYSISREKNISVYFLYNF